MTPRRLVPLIVLALAAWLTAPASAHFNLNLNVRILHVEHVATGLRLYLRTPMPYLVADLVGPEDAAGLPAPAPFTTNRMDADKLVHLVDPVALAADPLGLGRIARDRLRLVVAGTALTGEVVTVRVHPVGREPGFAMLSEVQRALAEAPVFPPGSAPPFVGDTLVDVVIDVAAEAPVSAYTIAFTTDPGLAGQAETANVVLDHRPGGTEIFRARGLMLEPIAVGTAPLAGVATFVAEGVRHILGGLDHVLFVLCLVLGASDLRGLVWRVTGFTLGHSVTLTTGFFGFVPAGAWFVPTVETGIALSIIYAAAITLRPGRDAAAAGRTMFLVTAGIGLLHGLGFSFVLREILAVTAPNIWQSLLAFNVGVEIGQLAVVLLVWPALLLLHRLSLPAWRASRLGISTACILIASLWTVERVRQVLATT